MVRAMGGRVTIEVRRADAAEILSLRHAVLRPGLHVEVSHYPQDDVAVHVGAWDDGELVGCGTVFADPWHGPPPEPAAWRVRGMAVAPTRQGEGIGRLVLDQLVAAARAAGTPLVWANARSAALDFYLRQGWQVAGAEFVTTDTGLPHFPIVLISG